MAEKIWQNDRLYAFLRPYVDMCTRSCHRSVRVEGRDRIPKEGAVLLAPNHCATLMDALMVLLLEKGAVGFGARSDIFAKPRIARILRWLRIVPLARERNGLSEVAKNLEVFREIVDCLDHEVPFCMFSEGRHRAERGMLPVKKGVFRIAKLALETTGKQVFVVPVGIDYEDLFAGQRRAAIRIGEPIDVGAVFAERGDRPDAETYQWLCEELRARILPLIGQFTERRSGRAKGLRWIAAVLSLPLFAVCALGALPIWLPYLWIMRKMEDKAWSHTVRFALHFVLPLFIPFHIGFERLLHFYATLR